MATPDNGVMDYTLPQEDPINHVAKTRIYICLTKKET